MMYTLLVYWRTARLCDVVYFTRLLAHGTAVCWGDIRPRTNVLDQHRLSPHLLHDAYYCMVPTTA